MNGWRAAPVHRLQAANGAGISAHGTALNMCLQVACIMLGHSCSVSRATPWRQVKPGTGGLRQCQQRGFRQQHDRGCSAKGQLMEQHAGAVCMAAFWPNAAAHQLNQALLRHTHAVHAHHVGSAWSAWCRHQTSVPGAWRGGCMCRRCSKVRGARCKGSAQHVDTARLLTERAIDKAGDLGHQSRVPEQLDARCKGSGAGDRVQCESCGCCESDARALIPAHSLQGLCFRIIRVRTCEGCRAQSWVYV